MVFRRILESLTQAVPQNDSLPTGVPAKEALARGKANPHDRWIGGASQSARDRIATQVVVPLGQQSFTARPDSTFFAMGSCFARNVEERLALAGANVLSRKINARDLGATSGRTLGIYNKYTPFSILQELQFASGERDFPEEGFLPASGEMFYDAQLRVNSGEATIAELHARRAELREAFAQTFAADVVILTLGLIEAWFDRKTSLYLTEMPAPRLIQKEPERFEFRCLSIEDCREALAQINALLKRHSKPSQKMIITVSPVALGRTFTPDDIIIANTTSKSTLRVAALEFTSAHDHADYFPSYEAVTLSAPALAWQDDRLHASDFIVGRIISTFLTRYGLGETTEQNEDSADKTPEELLIMQLRRDVDKYKNQLIQMEKKVQAAQS